MIDFNLWPTISFVLVMLSWLVFAAVFLARKKPKEVTESKRASQSIVGVSLQGLSYAIVWTMHRPFFSPIFRVNRVVEILLAAATAIIAFGSVWIVTSAVHTLGKEWSVTARLVEGHELATRGVYRFIRHPIYSGMLGMLLATGLAISSWISLLVAVLVFLIGTNIRVRIEERLLLEEFGPRFEEYRKQVAALIPGVY